jgi:hypothetical protein
MKSAMMNRTPLDQLMEIIGVLMEKFEDEHVPDLSAN